MKIVRVCKAMTPGQRDLIIGADLGDLLDMKCSKLIPELCRFLMDCFNPETCMLDFGKRGRIPITDESVCKVMGAPIGRIHVPYHLDVDTTSLVLEMFKIHDGKQPKISQVELELGPTYRADQAYLRKFIIYVVSSVFAPTTEIKVSPRCYPCVINTTSINRLNWARFIIDVIIHTTRAKEKKNWFKVYMPYLMVSVCNITSPFLSLFFMIF